MSAGFPRRLISKEVRETAYEISLLHPKCFKKRYSDHRAKRSTGVPCRYRPDSIVKVGIASIDIELFSDDGTRSGYHCGVETNEQSDQAAYDKLPIFLLR